MLTQQELKELLHYDPTTGVFTWKTSFANHIREGRTAGSLRQTGYIAVKIFGHEYGAHRLAWVYTYGDWPENQIDHIDGVRHNNRIVNLRQATHTQNAHNSKKRRGVKCGLKGAFPYRGKFRAKICVKGKNIYLGDYNTEEEAHAAYMAAAKEEFGAFARAE